MKKFFFTLILAWLNYCAFAGQGIFLTFSNFLNSQPFDSSFSTTSVADYGAPTSTCWYLDEIAPGNLIYIPPQGSQVFYTEEDDSLFHCSVTSSNVSFPFQYQSGGNTIDYLAQINEGNGNYTPIFQSGIQFTFENEPDAVPSPLYPPDSSFSSCGDQICYTVNLNIPNNLGGDYLSQCSNILINGSNNISADCGLNVNRFPMSSIDLDLCASGSYVTSANGFLQCNTFKKITSLSYTPSNAQLNNNQQVYLNVQTSPGQRISSNIVNPNGNTMVYYMATGNTFSEIEVVGNSSDPNYNKLQTVTTPNNQNITSMTGNWQQVSGVGEGLFIGTSTGDLYYNSALALYADCINNNNMYPGPYVPITTQNQWIHLTNLNSSAINSLAVTSDSSTIYAGTANGYLAVLPGCDGTGFVEFNWLNPDGSAVNQIVPIDDNSFIYSTASGKIHYAVWDGSDTVIYSGLQNEQLKMVIFNGNLFWASGGGNLYYCPLNNLNVNCSNTVSGQFADIQGIYNVNNMLVVPTGFGIYYSFDGITFGLYPSDSNSSWQTSYYIVGNTLYWLTIAYFSSYSLSSLSF